MVGDSVEHVFADEFVEGRTCATITARAGSIPSVEWGTISFKSHTRGADTAGGSSAPEGRTK
jgi:hypothetical protein